MPPASDIPAIEQPRPALLTYYLVSSFVIGPLFPILLIPRLFRFRTLRYRFDEEGVSMSWGALFRREIHLTYGRIQDIHLTSNVVERWLGLARIQIQTASGSAKAEMTIEGLEAHREVRDFLYERMRGAKDPARASSPSAGTPGFDAELEAILREVADELRKIRLALAQDQEEGPPPSDVAAPQDSN